ncbi:transcriptional repressor [Palleronia sediminis]|uniref:Transcriptional repressor n=1 Tax=Palleronia sediminis TaxID=2547833 RepID=A0A4R6AK34_9RHOB|nr:transcriptional repressor [Palleronia sediminis]TDL83725.1 transcriptional repressor [Palleronia sediminis]
MSCQSFTPHDHAACRAEALEAARARCAASGLRLTPARERTLAILLDAPRALGAYDILGRLAAEGHGAQPPAVYRALDFLTAQGFAHRVEKLNAFVACARPGAAHRPSFLICRGCDAVSEQAAPAAPPALAAAARAAGFTIEDTVLEATGLCPGCIGTRA